MTITNTEAVSDERLAEFLLDYAKRAGAIGIPGSIVPILTKAGEALSRRAANSAGGVEVGAAELIQRLVVPMVEQRSREPNDAWARAARILSAITHPSSSVSAEVTEQDVERVWQAVLSCPHSITGEEIVLGFSSDKPGKNAAAQLHSRILAALNGKE